MKYKKHQRLEIEWIDSTTKDGWMEHLEVSDFMRLEEGDVIKVIGYFVGETENYIYIVGGLSEYLYHNVFGVYKTQIKKVIKI